MNTKLVESLAQIIQSLSPEEMALLEDKLYHKHNSQEEYRKLLDLRTKVYARRGDRPLDPPPEEIIHQMREERTEQLIQANPKGK